MLRQLYAQTTGTMNPSYLTNTLPGGAAAATAGTTPNPGISAPYIEDFETEVIDITAPTLITPALGTTKTYLGTPAIQGKLLVLDPINAGPGGTLWKQNSTKGQAIPGGQYGIVVKAGLASATGVAIGSPQGNVASSGAGAVVVTDGPVLAFCQTTVGGLAISAGMPLQADGAGNLTPINQGTFGGTGAALPPLPGQVLATALGPVASSISIPVLAPVYLGGY